MSKRRHLGTVYETYPAKDFESFLVTVIFKIITIIVSSIIWLGIFWVGIGIINFLRVNLLELKEMPLEVMYRTPAGQGTYWGGVAVIGVYVLISKVGARKKSDASTKTKAIGAYEAHHQ